KQPDAYAAGLSRLARIDFTVFTRACTKETQSSRREFQPRLTLIAPIASAGSTPIALNTCDRCTFPDEQAEPDDTAKPSISKAISNTCASMEERPKQDVFGNLGAPAPKNTTPGKARAISASISSRQRDSAVVCSPSRAFAAARPAAIPELRQYFPFPRATPALGRRRAEAHLLCGK